MGETATPSGGNVPARDGNGHYRRTVETAARDGEACRLHARGLSYDAIADELGYADGGNAWRAVQRGLAATAKTHGAEVLRAMMEAELAEVRRESWIDVSNPQPLVGRDGRPVLDSNGDPIPDRVQKAASLKNVLAANKQLSTLRGLDAAKRSVSTSTSVTVGVDMPIADIETQMQMLSIALDRRLKERERDEQRAKTISAQLEPPDVD
jgi:hypothetical protein